MEDIDRIADILYRLRAMIGAVYYLMNSEGTYHEPPVQHIETWLSDIGDKLDEVIKLL
jgi:hypothetical protein